jgi:histidyl-tRNA synthetase
MQDKARPAPARLQPVRGMQDFIGADAARFDHVVARFRDVAARFGYRSVHVPVVEQTQVFARTLGETTDVVAKEMYSFADRNGESLTLRPEFTAGICRAFISEGWQQYVPLKIITHGALFRYERPQKGRYRQFHQIDAEVIGAAEPQADVELIAFADLLLKDLGIAGVTLQLNTLGDPESRAAWRGALVRHFSAHADALSAESRRRLETNPLRILDSKEPEDQELIAAAPSIDSALGSAAGAFFEAVQKGLQASGVSFVRQPRLVRGFDYYRHTAFEFVSDALGAQATVIGGGRYDGLIENMGGPSTPAVGWAGGIERLMLICSEPAAAAPEVALIPLSPDLEPLAQTVAMRLRAAGIGTELAFGGSEKKRFEKAKKAGIGHVLNIGPSPEGLAELRLRDIGRDAAPIARQLIAALAEAFVLRQDDETGLITVVEPR